MMLVDSYLGEIRLFGGNYEPSGWALCNGQLLSISEFDALYSLLGTTYGGNGRDNFAVPDLRGRIAVCEGSGAGLSPRPQGQSFGQETVTLATANIPPHQHRLQATTDTANTASPNGSLLAKMTESTTWLYEPIDNVPEDEIYPFSSQSVSNVGQNEAHGNLMPALCINYIIATKGIYPSRS